MRISMLFIVLFLFVHYISAADGYGSAPKKSGHLQPQILRIAILPDEDPAKIIKDNAAFVSYLEKKLQCSVLLSVPHDYSIMIESMRAGRLHLAYFGPTSYVICRDKGTKISPFAAKVKNGSTSYRTVIIGNTGMVQKLSDIAGKTFAYGDPASTSSHLIPKNILLTHKLHPRRDYKQLFLGSHDAVALNVQAGSVAAGGMSQSIYQQLLKKGRINAKHVKILALSDAFPQYPWVWRNDLAPTLKEKIRRAFLDLRPDTSDTLSTPSTHAVILKALHAQGFRSIDDAAYNVVRKLQRRIQAHR